ncbi:MAG: GAF domain-containing protein [Rubrivivax sp.]|nr:GAF domain-containing protein [Rubrivivax sp.]
MSRSFIRAVEVWLPSEDATLLEFAGGHFPPASRMPQVSRGMCFGRGEGLPGRAWDLAAPVVLHDFAGSYFRRTEAALADGLNCGMAWPIFAGTALRAVVVFFCGDDEAHAGAIELWHNDPANPALGHDMVLLDGHYGRTADTFEFISRRTSFRRGTGLPGMAWASHAPVFLPDLGRGSGFLRADGAQKVGINRGLALPCSVPGPQAFVLTFLSALGTPIAQRVEVWRPLASTWTLAEGFCETQGSLAGLAIRTPAPEVALCRDSARPVVGSAPAAPIVALPVLDRGTLVAVVALQL